MSIDFLLGIGSGILLTSALLSPVLVRAYRAYRDDREVSIARRVVGILRDNMTARQGVDPDQVPARTGRPSRQRDAVDALFHTYANARTAMDKLEDDLKITKEKGENSK
jgi:hypothetical protein